MADVTAWMIEMVAGTGPLYFTGSPGVDGAFTQDPNAGARFPTKDAAARWLEIEVSLPRPMRVLRLGPSCYGVREHQWIDSPAVPAGVAVAPKTVDGGM
jgi:hypothetical protein